MGISYSIQNAATGFFVDVEEKKGTPGVGTPIDGYTGTAQDGPKPNQLWTFEEGPVVALVDGGFPAVHQSGGMGDNFYYIKSALNGLVIEVQEKNGGFGPGATLCLAKPTGSLNQLWSIYPYTTQTEVDIDDSEPLGVNYIFIMNGVGNPADQQKPFVLDVPEAHGKPDAGVLLDAFPMKSGSVPYPIKGNNIGNQLWTIGATSDASHPRIENFPNAPIFEGSTFSVICKATGFAPGINMVVVYGWQDSDGNYNTNGQDPMILTADFGGNALIMFNVSTFVNTGSLSLNVTDYFSNSVTVTTNLAANGTFYNTAQS
jgi:hypothetical protein